MKLALRSLILMSLILALAASTACAQKTFNVPFNFTVAGTNCPAGVYSVQRDTWENSVTLQNIITLQTFKWSLEPGSPSPTDERVILKFATDGRQHILQFVQYRSRTTARLDRPFTKAEPPTEQIARGQ